MERFSTHAIVFLARTGFLSACICVSAICLSLIEVVSGRGLGITTSYLYLHKCITK